MPRIKRNYAAIIRNGLRRLPLGLRWKQALRPDRTRGGLQPDHDLRGRFCSHPFTQMDVYENGDVYACCSSWLPVPLGNLRRQSLDDIWNSSRAQAIRESIHDGSFRYCDHFVCPLIQNRELPTTDQAREQSRMRPVIDERRTHLDELPTFINLCNDASCNLWCPSCRTERINHTAGRALEKRRHLQDRVVQALFSEPTDRHFIVNVTGSGDPFASRIFREFLFDLDGRDFPNLGVHLQTNGVLLTPKNWKRMARIHTNIRTILVSFDAATPETYAVTRRGGHWETLLDNARSLGERRAAGELSHLRLDFVVQQANYREMPAFVRLARALGADNVSFSMVLNWGTWSPAEYAVRCIWRNDHPEFEAFMDVMAQPELGGSDVDLGNLTAYREHALSDRVPGTSTAS